MLPRLIVITDWRVPRERFLGVLDALLPLGARVAVQHRHPDVPVRTFLEEARLLAARCARYGNPLFVNERLDVALLVGAHLHLPDRGLAVEDFRALLPRGRWISAAVHAGGGGHGADLALVSPVFSPGSKPGDTRAPLGAEGFTALASTLACPAYALGGITPERVARLPGAAGFAVVSALWEAEDPAGVATRLLETLARRPQGSRAPP